ncbi:NACHT, LRR and PYD domains-containing protein 3-like [Gastrophryne carolinensis]
MFDFMCRDFLVKRSSADHEPTTIQALLGHQDVTKTVALQGPARIGKTMITQKIMLDWASGDLFFRDRFHLIFYLRCKEIKKITGDLNLAELLSGTCVLLRPDWLAPILKDSRSHGKLLFIVDGLEELAVERWTPMNKHELCRDVSVAADKELLVKSLIGKEIMRRSSVIITTRPWAVARLDLFHHSIASVRVQGLAAEDLEGYVRRFFGNKEEASEAFRVIRDNDVLRSMCAAPKLCWMVCAVLRPQIKKGQELKYDTATSVYLLYLEHLLTGHGGKQQALACLKKLCALANEEVLAKKVSSSEEDLKRHGLSVSGIQSSFPDKSVFLQDPNDRSCFCFVHPTMQQFLAALHYVLDRGPRGEEGEDSTLPEICKESSVSRLCHYHPHLSPSIRSLFGLQNVKRVEKFSKSTGCRISLWARSALGQWLVGGIRLFHPYEISCLYETQDKDFVRETLSGFSYLNLSISEIDAPCVDEKRFYKQLCFCLENCDDVRNITFEYFMLDPDDLRTLSPFLRRCRSITLPNCGLASILKDDVVVKIRSLTKLHLQYNPLEKCAIKPLCEALRDPGCTLQELRLSNCHLSSSSCEDLRSVLITSRSLTMLDLSTNNLQDSGVRVLCEGLRHPGCALRDLNLSSCKITSLSCDTLGSAFINRSLIKLNLDSNQIEDSGVKLLCQGLGDLGCTLRHLSLQLCRLTEIGCEALRSIFFTNRSLTNLDLTHDRIKDSGMKLLCEGLKHPDCTLQELSLPACGLTPLCCDDISNVLTTNRTLTKLDLSSNFLEDSGVTRLCEGLRDPGCKLQELW